MHGTCPSRKVLREPLRQKKPFGAKGKFCSLLFAERTQELICDCIVSAHEAALSHCYLSCCSNVWTQWTSNVPFQQTQEINAGSTVVHQGPASEASIIQQVATPLKSVVLLLLMSSSLLDAKR